jgi:C4-dicarboxylate transporter, DctM subunit
MTLAWIGIGLLALFGAPLFIVIGAAALLGFHGADIDSSAVIAELYSISSAPTLLAIPLFTFAGYLMAEGGSSARLLRLSRAILGWVPGGLSVVALATCAFFTAFTGASGVTIIALGGLLYPAMVRDRYPERYTLGLLTAGGSLGLLFPPSLPIILYGIVSQVSIDQLFVAGVFPGIFLVVLLSVYGVFVGLRSGVELIPFSGRELLAATREALWEIPLPFIVLVGIYGGYFTANQAAAVTAVYAFVVQVFIYRDLRLLGDVPRVARDSMVLVGGILIILGVALGLKNYLVDADVPQSILEMIQVHIHSKLMFLLALNVFLLIVGCLMDIFSAIIVVVPLITPLALAYGVDPVHLGIIFLTNLEIGYLTPPVGINLFISSFRFGKPVLELYRAALPFLAILLVGLMVITYWPDMSLALGRWLGLGSTGMLVY